MKVNASPEAFMIKDKDYSIVSCSPETLIDKKKNTIITKPIAGTLKKTSIPINLLLINSLKIMKKKPKNIT